MAGEGKAALVQLLAVTDMHDAMIDRHGGYCYSLA